MLHVYWMHDAEWFGVYGESAFQIPVRLPDGCTIGLLAVPRARIGRRRGCRWELYGPPKKPGKVELAPNGDLLVGRVSRNGIDIATATMCFKQTPAFAGRARAATCQGRRTTST